MRPRLIVLAFLLALPLPLARPAATAPIQPGDLAGTWAGVAEHEGEARPVALTFEPDSAGIIAIRLTMPVVHLDHVLLGRAPLREDSAGTRLGPFRLALDPAARTLATVMPAGLVPVYRVPLTLTKVDRFDLPPRAPLAGPVVEPAWSFDAGAALWAGPTHADGVVFVGAEDGRVHALDARTGRARWSYRAGGPVRARPAVAGRDLYVQADDGLLYALDAATGAPRWRTRIVDSAIVRLPFDDPRSRFDRFASDVVVAGDRLFVGTHDGKVLALDRAKGTVAWEFRTGEAVLAAPALAGDRVVVGSFDRHVYALDRASGRRLWKTDTRGAVVSTPAVHDGLAIVGNRAYDLLGLDLATGAVRWKRYVWMSWVESSPVVADGTAYVGSSDAAALFAVDAATGQARWTADVHGWSWGQPAVTADRVYAGTSSQVGYLAEHAGGVLALERRTGAVAWRAPSPAPASGPYGFPGSPAVGSGLVFVGGLDGKVLAFRP